MADRALSLEVEGRGTVSALLRLPGRARALLVLAHGAGAGMAHPFMESVAGVLADRGVGTLRYNFPYMEAGRRRPDRAPVATATVRAAVEAARREIEAARREIEAAWREVEADATAAAPPIALYAGGKSFGARMTSTTAADGSLEGVAGLVFLGFPLHPIGRPDTARADHLARVTTPMLFVQGTRDRLADLDLLRPVIDQLGRKATLHVVEGADHSFRVPKRSGRTEEEVLAELANAVAAFTAR